MYDHGNAKYYHAMEVRGQGQILHAYSHIRSDFCILLLTTEINKTDVASISGLNTISHLLVSTVDSGIVIWVLNPFSLLVRKRL